ncbi:head-tail connector protein [Emticicia fontis]
MKRAFISSSATSSIVPTLLPYATLDEWSRGYGTTEEHSRLGLLVEEIRAKVENESGLRIGSRTFTVKTDHFPHNEVFDIYPVTAVTKVECWNEETEDYEELAADQYQLEHKDEKMSVVLFSGQLPQLPCKETAVQITVTAGCADWDKVPAMAKGAIRTYVETYFRDKMPSEVKSATEAIDRSINSLRLWL